MANSQTVEDFMGVAKKHRTCLFIKGSKGPPPRQPKILFRDSLVVSNPISLDANVLYKPAFISGGQGQTVFSIADSFVYKPEIKDSVLIIDGLSTDMLRAAIYSVLADGKPKLQSLLAQFQNTHKTATYGAGQFEFLDQKDVQERAPNLVDKPIEPTTLATVSPLEIITEAPITMQNFVPHRLDEGLVLRISTVEPNAEPLTFEGGVSTLLKLGEFAYKASNYNRAMDYYLQYLRTISDNNLAWECINEILKRDTNNARGWLMGIKDVEPFDPDTWLRKAQAAECAGIPEFTFDFYYQALLRRTSLEVWPNIQAAMANITNKEDLFARLERIEPRSAPMWQKRAGVASTLGDSYRAISYHTAAFRLNPKDEKTLTTLKELLRKYHG